MKAVLICVLAAACLAGAVSPPLAQRFRFAKADPPLTCPAEVTSAAYGQHVTYKPIGSEAGAMAKWDEGKKKFVWEANALNNVNGEAQKAGDALPDNLDLCKIQPKSFCNQQGTNHFCALEAVVKANLCCPLKGVKTDSTDFTAFTKRKPEHRKGCPGSKVAGMPRAFMPQLVFVPNDKPDATTGLGAAEKKFIAFVKAQNAPFSKDFGIKKETILVRELKPSQDEIFAQNSFSKVCTEGFPAKVRATPSPQPPSMPLVCKDNYIYDGHHRWSQNVFCKYVKNCKPAETIDVLKASATCADLIELVQKFIEYPKDGKAPVNFATMAGTKSKTVKDTANGNAEVIEFSTFTELEERFGMSAHASVEAAGRAYVETTRARLAEVGLELKGGDEALHALWEHNYAPQLWH